jgi:hypothetical protein
MLFLSLVDFNNGADGSIKSEQCCFLLLLDLNKGVEGFIKSERCSFCAGRI